MPKIAIDCRFVGKKISGIAKYLIMMLKGLQQVENMPFDIVLIVSKDSEEIMLLKKLLGKVPFFVIPVNSRPHTIKDQFLLPDVLKNNKINGIGIIFPKTASGNACHQGHPRKLIA